MKHILLFINHYTSKLSVWSWQKLWGNRQKGYGYRCKLARIMSFLSKKVKDMVSIQTFSLVFLMFELCLFKT